MEDIAGRMYAKTYRTSGKADIVDALTQAVAESGGRVLHISAYTRAPVHLSALTSQGRTVSAMIYPFRGGDGGRGRAAERRFQLRLGSEERWGAEEHPVGADPARVEPTIILGVHLEEGVFVAVDPSHYDPLPMGASIWQPVDMLAAASDPDGQGWVSWEQSVMAGARRAARAEAGFETMVAFRPDRLLDYMAFETEAQALGLDGPLRQRLAEAASGGPVDRHDLEERFGLPASEILDIISGAKRLGVAVRGGVAEAHLARHLGTDVGVRSFDAIDEDGRHDFDVDTDRGRLRVECKNASPDTNADGVAKVEVQKTRGRIPERLYLADQFDIVAACIWSVTGYWEFRYALTADLDRHPDHPDRLKSVQFIDGRWSESLSDLLTRHGDADV